ncbi:serine/threonine-protein phosphatase 4 regulatory subunit 2-like isoform X2 [Dunckerocampus dactyliophorus]|uniref:serine/threonine-protein phosphatase 4 regulatory subunit 2-like isoform X2 n=1 Tax=Dunckerocampus dactyliophorus TaxID=161453 RepID=UPI002407672D|nr:serine/threonine-protein phosphatase 4 regulatory subunit 2-like isoform X2 [Dunckerocampus dactyliophorus]
MDTEALLEAFQDFEKKVKRDTSPALEQFLCHVAKTGESLIPWPQFKSYFMFKLEKVIDDFHASTPEQRGPHNPNVEHVPFEEMKNRILKIVDSYNGIPFTIQRLCELLTDPKRNYSGTDKFLRGIEKNVMVVSCVYSTSEKNRASSSNRMNGVMFPGNSPLCSDSRNVNGPGMPTLLNRPKLSLSPSLSTNGLPECEVSKEPITEEEEEAEHHISDGSLMGGEITPRTRTKNKHPEDDAEDSDAEKHNSKRLKVDKKQEEGDTKCENKEYSRKGTDNSSPVPESSEDSCGQAHKSEASSQSILEDPGPSSSQTGLPEKEAAEREEAHLLNHDITVDQPERPQHENTHSEQDTEDSSSSISDGDCLASIKLGLSSSGNSPNLSTGGDADNSNCTKTDTESGQND